MKPAPALSVAHAVPRMAPWSSATNHAMTPACIWVAKCMRKRSRQSSTRPDPTRSHSISIAYHASIRAGTSSSRAGLISNERGFNPAAGTACAMMMWRSILSSRVFSMASYDIVIIGGSLGGCAAALAAGGGDYSVCLLEASEWLGGQYSAQGVTKPDESRYTSTVGSTAAYRAFQHDVRAFYRANYNLSARGENQPSLNPGGAYPGFSTQPRVAHQILLQALQALPNVHVRLGTSVTAANVQGDTVQSVATLSNGVATTYEAHYFLDATDLGELLPLANVEFSLGAESKG